MSGGHMSLAHRPPSPSSPELLHAASLGPGVRPNLGQ